jgi:hypothetical protein
LLSLLTAGVNETGGKASLTLAAKLPPVSYDSSDKVTSNIVDTGGKLPPVSPAVFGIVTLYSNYRL